MSTDIQRLLDDALRLSDNERAELAARLIRSLDPAVDQDAQAAWDVEIARRIEELDGGAVETLPWSEARRQILGTSDAPFGD